MMNINQLNYTLDSLNTNFNNEITIQKETHDSNNTVLLSEYKQNNAVLKEVSLDSIFALKKRSEKISILSNASAVAENIKFTIQNNENALIEKNKNINRHWVAFYEKFVIAFSCLLMFFVGDRKSTRLNSSHVRISYAVFCLKKKKNRKSESCVR